MRLFCWVLASIKITQVVTVGTFRFHANTQESFEFHVLTDSPLNWEKSLCKECEHPLSEDPGWWDDHSLDEKWYLLDSAEQNSLLPPFSLQWGKFWHQLCYACVNNHFAAENLFDCGLGRAGPAESSSLLFNTADAPQHSHSLGGWPAGNTGFRAAPLWAHVSQGLSPWGICVYRAARVWKSFIPPRPGSGEGPACTEFVKGRHSFQWNCATRTAQMDTQMHFNRQSHM